MKNFGKILAIAAMAATTGIFTSCDNIKGNTRVEATVENADEVFISRIEPGKLTPIDTLKIEDNKFRYGIDLEEITFLLFEFPEGERYPVALAPGERMKVEIDLDSDFSGFKSEGSPGTARLDLMRSYMQQTMNVLDSLDAFADSIQEYKSFGIYKAELDRKFEESINDHREKLISLINKEPGDLTNIFIFNQSVGRLTLLRPESDFEYFKKVNDALLERYPEHEHAKAFTQNIKEFEMAMDRGRRVQEAKNNIQVGNVIPEIVLPDPTGNEIALSSLRGQVVLVDFWAQWCRPCRMQNPHLVQLYNKHRKEGFTIYGVSLDGIPQQPNPKNAWVSAIEEDNLPWPYQVSDLKGWDSSVITQFGLDAIPYSVLIDRNGIILAKNLRGKELEKAIEKALANHKAGS